MDKLQTEMWDALCELDGETVLRLLTDWHGTQLLDEGFRSHLADEGVMDEVDDNDDNDDEYGFREFCARFPRCQGCPIFEKYCGGDNCEEIWERMEECAR